jgi:hypothetical protein
MITCLGRKISKPHVQNSHLSEIISDRWPFVVRTEKVRLFFIFRAYLETESFQTDINEMSRS